MPADGMSAAAEKGLRHVRSAALRNGVQLIRSAWCPEGRAISGAGQWGPHRQCLAPQL